MKTIYHSCILLLVSCLVPLAACGDDGGQDADPITGDMDMGAQDSGDEDISTPDMQEDTQEPDMPGDMAEDMAEPDMMVEDMSPEDMSPDTEGDMGGEEDMAGDMADLPEDMGEDMEVGPRPELVTAQLRAHVVELEEPVSLSWRVNGIREVFAQELPVAQDVLMEVQVPEGDFEIFFTWGDQETYLPIVNYTPGNGPLQFKHLPAGGSRRLSFGQYDHLRPGEPGEVFVWNGLDADRVDVYWAPVNRPVTVWQKVADDLQPTAISEGFDPATEQVGTKYIGVDVDDDGQMDYVTNVSMQAGVRTDLYLVNLPDGGIKLLSNLPQPGALSQHIMEAVVPPASPQMAPVEVLPFVTHLEGEMRLYWKTESASGLFMTLQGDDQRPISTVDLPTEPFSVVWATGEYFADQSQLGFSAFSPELGRMVVQSVQTPFAGRQGRAFWGDWSTDNTPLGGVSSTLTSSVGVYQMTDTGWRVRFGLQVGALGSSGADLGSPLPTVGFDVDEDQVVDQVAQIPVVEGRWNWFVLDEGEDGLLDITVMGDGELIHVDAQLWTPEP